MYRDSIDGSSVEPKPDSEFVARSDFVLNFDLGFYARFVIDGS